VVRDGEGATKLVEVRATGARSDAEARIAAMAVAESPLFKCAVFGQDANWGRVVSAVGASRARIDPKAIAVTFAGVVVARGGTAVPFDEEAVAEALAEDRIEIKVDLGVGEGEAAVWTCDLTYDYVRINADYRS
jgi:glutamate N-acetyltransferase/amino-acid N-acetyltransferase